MSRPLPPLTAPLAPVFTVADARRNGVGGARLRGSDLTPAGHGLRARAGEQPAWEDRLRALQELHPTGVFSHGTAARLWGIWLPDSVAAEPTIHLAKPRGAGGTPSRREVTPHQLNDDAEVTELRGLRLTRPAWTWLDLAQSLPLEDLVVAGDSLLPSPHGADARRLGRLPPRATTAEDLARITRARSNVRGVLLAREAATLVRTGADSPAETRLRLRLVAEGFPEPAVNPRIETADGRWFRVDLCWEELRAVLEFDGDQHRTDKAQWRKDRERRRALEADGWDVTWVAGDVFTRAGWPVFVREHAARLRDLAARRRRPLE